MFQRCFWEQCMCEILHLLHVPFIWEALRASKVFEEYIRNIARPCRNHLREIIVWVSKGFLQSEVLGEVSVLEGRQFRAKFLPKCSAKFFTKFSGLFCWDIQTKKIFSENFSPEFPWLCTAKLEKKSGKNFMTRFCRGTLANVWVSYSWGECCRNLAGSRQAWKAHCQNLACLLAWQDGQNSLGWLSRTSPEASVESEALGVAHL